MILDYHLYYIFRVSWLMHLRVCLLMQTKTYESQIRIKM